MKGKRLRSDSNCVLSVDSRSSIDNDEIQTSLAPYIQTYLSHSTGNNTCGCLPVPFERAAEHSWIRPRFDSDILEGQFKSSSSAHFIRRFRYALAYLVVVNAVWLGFAIFRYPQHYSIAILFAQFCILFLLTYLASFHKLYKRHSQKIAIFIALWLTAGAIFFSLACPSVLSHFAVVSYTVVIIYTIFPLPPYICLTICASLTITFQLLDYFKADQMSSTEGFLVRLLCLFCMNIIGFHVAVMVNVRMRGTFMKVGQRLLVRRQLEAEKQLKEKMIHSVMPPKVAGWLLNPNPSLSDSSGQNKATTSAGDIRSMFRPFNMVRMDNVSILFADIVGFTRMSSNKTAEQIVDILNDLFNRFDELCLLSGCEKISTLGDCYYCVSGCPEPRDDHAKCCVEMGLGMIDAIQEFDVERSEDVNMRVGVHTGTVLCGVVGMRRFKFDVWSNDVSFANKLESTGLAGRVHVSELTVKFLNDAYVVEEFESSLDVKTYLIKERERPPSVQVRMNLSISSSSPPLPRSADVKARHTSPGRTRLNSCNSGTKRPHYLSLITEARSKFTSLPNVLVSSNAPSSNSTIVPRKSSSIRWQFPFPRSWRDPSPEVITMEPLDRLDVPKTETNLHTDEEVSLCPSATSRKDSGIKSTSRRSSIQQQIYLMNGLGQQELMTHRVSGYFTSSRSSLPHSESECDMSEPCRGPSDDGLGTCFYSLRKQSDLQLIRCVRDITQRSYFVKVPLRRITLHFRNDKMESDYRKHVHHIDENLGDSPVTLSTARYNSFLDIIVSTIVHICITIGIYILYRPSVFFSAIASIALVIQLAALILCSLYLTQKLHAGRHFIIRIFSDWYPWHVFGGVLISLPIILTLAGFSCVVSHKNNVTNTLDNLNFLKNNNILLPNIEFFDYYYTFLLLASLTHFCNFTQLNSLLKNIIAIASIIIFLSLNFLEKCQLINKNYISTVFIAKFISNNFFLVKNNDLQEVSLCCEQINNIISNLTNYNAQKYYELGDSFLNIMYNGSGPNTVFYVTNDGFQLLEYLTSSVLNKNFNWKNEFLNDIAQFINYDHYELVLNIIIILFLVILLNRELETNYRASYFFNVESNKDKIHVQYLKNQADMLLENIIPKHVSVELKNRAKYCENHRDVGIIFASIVNFNKLYDETYSGGKEYLRYLNELISDFDELLKEFKHVEKIKTIGSTFMAASGLNPELRKQNLNEYDHIHELMEFAKAMYKIVDEFNGDLLGFNLILRVGFNIGEVTAGVIGSSKLFYDIWGDTVNVASRMDTTGIDGKIQFPSSCLKYVADRYQFEPRGSVCVKGKGDIMVYLLKN